MRTNEIAQIVLLTWPGTPEELGSDLYAATETVGCRQGERNALQNRVSARRRIEECVGGRELIAQETEDLSGWN